MSKRRLQLFYNNLMSNIGIFAGMYLVAFPFLIIVSVTSGIIMAFSLPTIAMMIVLIVNIPLAVDEADRQIYYENKETLDVLRNSA